MRAINKGSIDIGAGPICHMTVETLWRLCDPIVLTNNNSEQCFSKFVCAWPVVCDVNSESESEQWSQVIYNYCPTMGGVYRNTWCYVRGSLMGYTVRVQQFDKVTYRYVQTELWPYWHGQLLVHSLASLVFDLRKDPTFPQPVPAQNVVKPYS